MPGHSALVAVVALIPPPIINLSLIAGVGVGVEVSMHFFRVCVGEKMRLRAPPSLAHCFNRHVRLHRVRNETLLMRLMMESRFVGRGWQFLSAVGNLRLQPN